MIMAAATDWNSLPCDLAQLIANKFSVVEDFLTLACVSRNFRSSLKRDQWRPLDEVSQPPWLLLGCPDIYNSYDGERSALSIYNKKKIPMNQPQLDGRRFFGTTSGWILTLGLDFQYYLFNPLTQRHIAIPRPDINQDFYSYIQRAILIRRPPIFRFDDFIVVAIGIGGELSVLRPQKNTWETVKLGIHADVYDMAHYNGRIYVINSSGQISIFSNLDGPGPLIEVECVSQLLQQPAAAVTSRKYLVESSGDLLLVTRLHDEDLKETRAFAVFMFNPQTKKLTVVEDLGDRSLFVGDSQSISLSSPGTFNCTSNCIYFSGHNLSQMSSTVALPDKDMGVFDLRTRTIQPFSKGAQSLARATWFIPMLS